MSVCFVVCCCRSSWHEEISKVSKSCLAVTVEGGIALFAGLLTRLNEQVWFQLVFSFAFTLQIKGLEMCQTDMNDILLPSVK